MRITHIFAAAMTVSLLGASTLLAAPIDGEQTYGLLFREGTLDSVDRTKEMHYRREVISKLKPEAALRDTGTVALGFKADDVAMAVLNFRRDGKHRGLGQFPASVGNPMIMYFYESVVRDMAEAAGGSPFYIRNRVKESLINPSDIQLGEAQFDGQTVQTRTISLHPFAEDPNQKRMQGFGDLVLRVTMSDQVPGWYLSLEAFAGEGKVYRSMLEFEGLEDHP